MTLTGPDDAERDRLYEGGTYAPPHAAFDRWLEPLRRLSERDRMRSVAALTAGSSVLEVGAGDGRFVARLAATGHRVRGIDPSPAAVGLACDRGVVVQRASIETASVDRASLDAVILWHVLEHLADPEAALERVRSWLRPGGSVIVAVPNLDSLQARLGQDRWFHQDVPRHCTHFTARGLGLLLERSGFTLERIRHLLVEHNFLGMWQTLLNRVCRERDFAFRLLKHDLPGVPRRVVALDLAVTLLAGAVLAPIAIALELLAGLSGHGGTVFAVASVGPEQ